MKPPSRSGVLGVGTTVCHKQDFTVEVQFSDDLVIKDLIITLKCFPTHAPITQKKYIKIGGQQIHKGRLHYMSQAKAISYMETYLLPAFSKAAVMIHKLKMPEQVRTFFYYHLPKDFGAVSLRTIKGQRQLTGGDSGEWSNWDLGNLHMIWEKVMHDALVHRRIIVDDNVRHLKGTYYHHEEVGSLAERMIVLFVTTVPK